MTMTRLCTSTWVAARPTPGAAYIVSARSRTSFRISGVTAATGAAILRRRGSGNSRIVSRAMAELAMPGSTVCLNTATRRQVGTGDG